MQPLNKYPTGRIVLGGIVVALIALIVLWDWNWFKHPIERYVTHKTGRALVIGGNLGVKLGWDPVITVDNVHYDNPEWARDKTMIEAERIQFAFKLRNLFARDIVIPFVRLTKPKVDLERLADGRNNWTFSKADESASKSPPEVHQLAIDQGVAHYADAILGADIRVEANTIDTSAAPKVGDQALTTALTVTGTYRKTDFSGSANVPDILTLQTLDKPFALQAQVKSGTTNLAVRGTVGNLKAFDNADLHVRIAGASLANFYPLVPLPLPPSPPYSFDGQLKKSGDQYSYGPFTGKVGSSDLHGNASYAFKKPRPLLKARLESSLLSMDDLGPLIGFKPGSGKSKAAADRADAEAEASNRARSSKAQPHLPATVEAMPKRGLFGGSKKVNATANIPAGKSAGTANDESGNQTPPGTAKRLMPAAPLNLEKLNAIDADVTLHAKKLDLPDEVPLENLSVALSLNDGLLKLQPLTFGFAGGEITSTISVNAQKNPLATNAAIDFRRVDLSRLFPTVGKMKFSTGKIGAQIRLEGTGNSLAQMLATSNGTVGIGMAGGSMSNLLVEVAGLDVAEALKYLMRGDVNTPIRCGAALFDFKSGQGTAREMVFDTGDTRINGSGTVNLREEQFDIRLKPEPKDFSLLVLRTPIRLYGNFSKPAYSIEAGGLLARGGGALALGLINPLAAILPLLETGPGTDTNCADVLKPVRGAESQANAPKGKAPPPAAVKDSNGAPAPKTALAK